MGESDEQDAGLPDDELREKNARVVGPAPRRRGVLIPVIEVGDGDGLAAQEHGKRERQGRSSAEGRALALIAKVLARQALHLACGHHTREQRVDAEGHRDLAHFGRVIEADLMFSL